MDINTFKRVEEKYLLDSKKKDLLFKEISKYLKKDKYFKTTISNIYFDNDNNDLIINSIEKPPFKEKFRLRGYNINSIDDDVFLEMKCKYKGIVSKRRVKLKLSDYYRYMDSLEYSSDSQIFKELNYFREYYNLVPKIYIAYDRESYCDVDDENLRITIDANLRSRRDNLKIEIDDNNMEYFDNDMYILEIKTLGSLPLWLVRVLSKLEIYPVSFSKYGSIYTREMIDDVR